MSDKKEKVKSKRSTGNEKITITMSELILMNVDRSRTDVKKWWYALQNAEQISNPNRSQLYDIYERIRLDGRLSGVVEKRITAVLNKTLHYEVDGKRVDEMDALIQSKKFREMMRRMLEKKFWGLTGLEFIPGAEFDFALIPRKHIKTDKKIISIDQNGQTGFDYTQLPFVMILEDVETFGLFLKCAPLCILKSGSLSQLAQYIELFGQPIRKGTYPADDIEAKENLKRAMKESGSSFNIVMPDGTNIEIIGDHVTNGDGKVHEVMLTNVNNELSVIVLGNVETTGNDNGGSNAKAKEQGKQQQEIHKSDLKDIADDLSCAAMQFILGSYGYPVKENGKFVFDKEFDLEELKSRKDIDLAISAKVPIAPDYWYDTYGIPKPDNFDKLWKEMEDERKAKFEAETNPPAPGLPAKKKKKLKNLIDEWEHDFEPNDEDSSVAKKVKEKALKFLRMLNDFFAPARN